MESWNWNKTWVQIKDLCVPSMGVPSHAILEAKNRKNCAILNLYISVATDTDEKSLGEPKWGGLLQTRPLKFKLKPLRIDW